MAEKYPVPRRFVPPRITQNRVYPGHALFEAVSSTTSTTSEACFVPFVCDIASVYDLMFLWVGFTILIVCDSAGLIVA